MITTDNHNHWRLMVVTGVGVSSHTGADSLIAYCGLEECPQCIRGSNRVGKSLLESIRAECGGDVRKAKLLLFQYCTGQ